MSTDAESREPDLPGPRRWDLPAVTDVAVVHRRYRQPRVYYKGLQRLEATEAIELSIQTTDEFPVRALSPALIVGDVELTEYERIGSTAYRFFAFDPDRLASGAPISLGWAGDPSERIKTLFSFETSESETQSS